MTPQALLIGVGAGLISAIVFVSATTGSALPRLVLFLLTPFSLYLTGLSLGAVPGLTGAIAATLVIALLANPAAAALFAASEAGPAVLLTRLALLSRGEGDAREWYPAGRLVAAAAFMAGAVATLVILQLGADPEEIAKLLKPIVEEFTKSQIAQLPGSTPPSEADTAELIKVMTKLLPGGLALSIMLTMLASLWLAARVTLASGLLRRPWPDLSRLELPRGAPLALFGVTLLTLAGGGLGLIAGGFAGAFYFAFMLMGLALAHFVTRGSPWRNFMLSTVYMAVVIFSREATLALVIFALAEAFFRFRDAPTRAPPPNEPPST
jgi:hypothetical protein